MKLGRFASRKAVPSFELLADKYLDEKYAPENVSEATGIPVSQIRRLAAEIAEAAFEKEVVD